MLVGQLHSRVLQEYLRMLMRGKIICTSSKMRKRMAARLKEEGQQIRALFKDLVSLCMRVCVYLLFCVCMCSLCVCVGVCVCVCATRPYYQYRASNLDPTTRLPDCITNTEPLIEILPLDY